MQGKSSKIKKFACQDCKQKESRPTPVKLESKKQNKKVLASRMGSGWEVSIERQEEATSHLYYLSRI